jgi:N-acylmannosamine kinase
LDQLSVAPADKIAVAVTGRVSAGGVWRAVNAKTLPNIHSVDLAALLSEKFGREVSVQNDATAAAFGEYVAGAGRGYRSIGFITVSTGVGGGFVLNGVPLVSASGLAGHVGFTTSRVARDTCGSGRHATVESVASGRAIARIAAERGHPSLDAKTVYQAHLAGVDWASVLIRQSGEAVAELCANLKTTLDLDAILIGGGIGLAEGYLALVESYLQTEPEIFHVPLLRADLGIRATFIGVLSG